jgi:hypothetical protein
LSILSLCVLVLAGGVLASPERNAVLDRVVDEVLDGQLDGRRVYITSEPIVEGTPVRAISSTVFTAPTSGWLVFIDDHARANFDHKCRYAFVDEASGELSIYQAVSPPRNLGEFHELDTEMKRLYEAAHEVRAVPYSGPIREGDLRQGGTCYAVLISGGYAYWSNYIRYYNDIQFIFTTLKEVYGYKDQDIYVLVSDGTDPAPDRNDGTNSPPDLDGDGTWDIEYPAELWAIDEVFDTLANKVTADDQVFVFSTDHGSSNGGWSVYLNLWNYESLEDWYFANLVNSLPAATFIFTMEQCYSGGFEDDLQTVPPRIFSSAARHDEYSWAMSNLLYDEYVYYWTSAVRWEDPYGNPVDADYDDDGRVTMDEAYTYALNHDTQPEHPQYDDNPSGLGADVTLDLPGPLCGDVNDDGSVTSGDGYHVLNYFGSGPQPMSCWSANVNGDSGLTSSDGYWLLNFLGDPVGFPLDCAPCEF